MPHSLGLHTADDITIDCWWRHNDHGGGGGGGGGGGWPGGGGGGGVLTPTLFYAFFKEHLLVLIGDSLSFLPKCLSIRLHYLIQWWPMMTSSNGNIFQVTGHLCGEFTGHRWIPRKKPSHAELWCFLWSAPWINGWVNNRGAGDLRRQHAHYDVTVMAYMRYLASVCWTVTRYTQQI